MSTRTDSSDKASQLRQRLQNSRVAEDSQLVTEESRHEWISAISCVLLIVSFTAVAGPAGTLAGSSAAFVWYVLGTPYAIATGFVLAGAVTATTDPLSVAMITVPCLLLVLAPTVSVAVPEGYAASVCITTVFFGGVTWVFVSSLPLWLTAVALLCSLGVVSYTIYRYQLLVLGLLDEDSSDSASSDGREETTQTEENNE